MPKYYFHLSRGEDLDLDTDGLEFASVAEAYDEAVEAAREMLAEAILAKRRSGGDCFEITSEDGALVATVPFNIVIPDR
ncbi:DUF6894 family protein [Rhizobium bangladeshense]|uniref:DUF6894 family protein n=1 Tax=Rhizobium bangladeshense TaxID=1138189 RepID=UPI0007E58586|nr:hypothetical protein [Rhizobium bangladeshense]